MLNIFHREIVGISFLGSTFSRLYLGGGGVRCLRDIANNLVKNYKIGHN